MKKILFPVFALFVLLSVCFAQNYTLISDASRRVVVGAAINSADGTVTNSFGFTFAAVPTVVSVQTGLLTTVTNVIEATTSNFVLRVGTSAGITNRWIAVGTL